MGHGAARCKNPAVEAGPTAEFNGGGGEFGGEDAAPAEAAEGGWGGGVEVTSGGW